MQSSDFGMRSEGFRKDSALRTARSAFVSLRTSAATVVADASSGHDLMAQARCLARAAAA